MADITNSTVRRRLITGTRSKICSGCDIIYVYLSIITIVKGMQHSVQIVASLAYILYIGLIISKL